MAQDENREPDRERKSPAGQPTGKPGSPAWTWVLFGVIFGFLLQKGGVAKYEVLIGMLLLQDFTVTKVMMSAVAVGMIGIYALRTAGLVKRHIKPTRYGASSLGGILFGIGFGLAAYCPGTGAAALGQGNFDAIAVVLGLMAGSYVFAEVSGWVARTVNRWGDRGVLTLDRLLNLKPRVLVPVVATGLVLVLAAIHVFVDPTP